METRYQIKYNIEDIDLYKAYFNNDLYYIEKYEEYRKGKIFIFNSNLLFNGFLWWMLYRKMYIEAIIIYLIFLISAFIIYWFTSLLPVLSFAIIFSAIVIFLSNYLYFRKAERVVKKYKKGYPNQTNESMLFYLSAEEKNSNKGIIIFIPFFILSIIALSYICLTYK